LGGEAFRVHSAVKAQHLFQLTVQKGVEPGQNSGHDRGHGLFRGVEGGAGEPFGLVLLRQVIHEELKLVSPRYHAGSQQFLHQLEHGHDVPPLSKCSVYLLGRKVFGQQQDDCGEHTLGGIVEILVLGKALPLGIDDGLG